MAARSRKGGGCTSPAANATKPAASTSRCAAAADSKATPAACASSAATKTTCAKWAGGLLSCELEAKQFAGLDFAAASQHAKDEAEKAAEAQIFDAIEENLPEGEEDEELNWEALAKLSNSRWKTNYRDKDIKKIGRDQLDETLIQKA